MTSNLRTLTGPAAIGHVRYASGGDTATINAQHMGLIGDYTPQLRQQAHDMLDRYSASYEEVYI